MKDPILQYTLLDLLELGVCDMHKCQDLCPKMSSRNLAILRKKIYDDTYIQFPLLPIKYVHKN